MTGKELFEKYKGHKANLCGAVGVICGYGTHGHSNQMIMNVYPEHDRGWPVYKGDDVAILLEKIAGTDRYYWVGEPNVLQEKHIEFMGTSDIAEKYVSDNFPAITDDEKDIYINIFMEGTKYIKNDTK